MALFALAVCLQVKLRCCSYWLKLKLIERWTNKPEFRLSWNKWSAQSRIEQSDKLPFAGTKWPPPTPALPRVASRSTFLQLCSFSSFLSYFLATRFVSVLDDEHLRRQKLQLQLRIITALYRQRQQAGQVGWIMAIRQLDWFTWSCSSKQPRMEQVNP